jgi:hypothetical protein
MGEHPHAWNHKQKLRINSLLVIRKKTKMNIRMIYKEYNLTRTMSTNKMVFKKKASLKNKIL